MPFIIFIWWPLSTYWLSTKKKDEKRRGENWCKFGSSNFENVINFHFLKGEKKNQHFICVLIFKFIDKKNSQNCTVYHHFGFQNKTRNRKCWLCLCVWLTVFRFIFFSYCWLHKNLGFNFFLAPKQILIYECVLWEKEVKKRTLLQLNFAFLAIGLNLIDQAIKCRLQYLAVSFCGLKVSQ